MAVGIVDINMAPVAAQTTDHSLQQQHGSWTSVWSTTSTCPLVAAQNTDINMVSGSCTDHEHQLGLWWHLDLRRLKPQNEPFFTLNTLWLFRVSAVGHLGCVWDSHPAYIPGMTIVTGAQGQHQGPELSCPQHSD